MGWKRDLKQASQDGLSKKEIKQINQQYDNVNRQQINQRIESKGYSVGAQPQQPQLPTGAAGYVNPQYNAFTGDSWHQMQAAGFSDQQIRDSIIAAQQQGMQVGERPQMVLDNWANENPDKYREFAQGPAAPYSSPGRVLFNPEGKRNIGLGRGGLQDAGITWYSTQGNPEGDLSNAPFDPQIPLDILENGKYLQSQFGMQRAMDGESPVPHRYMGDDKGTPTNGGQYAYGYNNYSSEGAQAYMQNLYGMQGGAYAGGGGDYRSTPGSINYNNVSNQEGAMPDYSQFNNAMMVQQAALWETMDRMNSDFLRGQEAAFKGRNSVGGSGGPADKGGAKTKKPKKASQSLAIKRV